MSYLFSYESSLVLPAVAWSKLSIWGRREYVCSPYVESLLAGYSRSCLMVELLRSSISLIKVWFSIESVSSWIFDLLEYKYSNNCSWTDF